MGNWFRQLWAKITAGFRRFMAGRYGGDKLNMTLVWVAFGLYIISLFISLAIVRLLLIGISYVVIGWSVFRLLSKNTYKRYRENARFVQWLDRLKDKEHKYFKCPKCKQPVRVPKGKGKIAITCPKCKEKFIRKS